MDNSKCVRFPVAVEPRSFFIGEFISKKLFQFISFQSFLIEPASLEALCARLRTTTSCSSISERCVIKSWPGYRPLGCWEVSPPHGDLSIGDLSEVECIHSRISINSFTSKYINVDNTFLVNFFTPYPQSNSTPFSEIW